MQAAVQGPAEVSGLYAEARALNLRARQVGLPDLRFAASREMAWHDRSLCAEVDPALFYPEDGEPAAPALRVCAACPVRPECLEHAVGSGEMFGIWGGLSERERRPLGPQHLDLRLDRDENGLAA
jgi:hypothetical protein